MRLRGARTFRNAPGMRAFRRLRYVAIAVVPLLLPATLLPSLGGALLWPIQSRFPRADLSGGPAIAGFIALGGGAGRAEEAVALGLRHREAKVVMTGREALAADDFLEMGIPRSRVRIETTATNTYENALHTARMLGPEKAGRWILVTSASHMPRAIGCFRKAGFTVEPWPVPDRIKDWRERLHRAAHEWTGMLVYWLEGRTDALFPSPQMPATIATAAVAANVSPGAASTP
jgi:uncharacterized SAM-binding protein YcdF (DUF218 family)